MLLSSVFHKEPSGEATTEHRSEEESRPFSLYRPNLALGDIVTISVVFLWSPSGLGRDLRRRGLDSQWLGTRPEEALVWCPSGLGQDLRMHGLVSQWPGTRPEDAWVGVPVAWDET